ncbi:hypothetical protein RB213_016197 [Colletotrichum asianum]
MLLGSRGVLVRIPRDGGSKSTNPIATHPIGENMFAQDQDHDHTQSPRDRRAETRDTDEANLEIGAGGGEEEMSAMRIIPEGAVNGRSSFGSRKIILGVPAYRHVTPTRYGPSRSGGGRHREGRQMRDGDHRRGPMMRGALGDDDERRYYERRPQYSRAGSYERRSDQDELVGEIDDQTEDSYAIGEHQKMVVSRRDDHEYRRGVRFK